MPLLRGAALAALLIFLLPLIRERAVSPRPPGLRGQISAGVRLGRDFKNHAWSAGGQVSVPVGRNLELRPSGDFFFPRDGRRGWQANGDAAIHIGQGGGLYAGGGVAFAHPAGARPRPDTTCSSA